MTRMGLLKDALFLGTHDRLGHLGQVWVASTSAQLSLISVPPRYKVRDCKEGECLSMASAEAPVSLISVPYRVRAFSESASFSVASACAPWSPVPNVLHCQPLWSHPPPGSGGRWTGRWPCSNVCDSSAQKQTPPGQWEGGVTGQIPSRFCRATMACNSGSSGT